MNISVANLDSKGITPNNTYNRKTINLGFGYDLSEKLSFKGNINYSNEYNKNPPVVSEQDNSIPTRYMQWLIRCRWTCLETISIIHEVVKELFPIHEPDKPILDFGSSQTKCSERSHIWKLSVKYDFTKWLSAQVRGGQDYWSRDQDYINLPTGKNSFAQEAFFVGTWFC